MIVTNYTGEVVKFNGTREEALERGLNVDCYNCSNCSNCSGCSYCSYCSDCSNCSGCSYCSYCSDCSDCSGLSDCYRCESQPTFIVTDLWSICIRKNGKMKIGCQDHSILQWMEFTDEAIDAMDQDASAFWKKWKPVIQVITEKEAEE